jgi:hypothetical protein
VQSAALHYTVQYYTVLHCTCVPYCTVYRSVVYCTVGYDVQYCNAPQCTALLTLSAQVSLCSSLPAQSTYSLVGIDMDDLADTVGA